MTRDEKKAEVADLVNVLKKYNFVYVADSSKLNGVDNNKLRRALYNNGIVMRVAKNTLIEKALEESNIDFKELKDTLTGHTTLLFAENAKSPALAIKDFRKKGENPKLKGAYIDSDVFVGDDKLEVLATLKSKEDLIGDIITILQSPAKNVISALSSGGGKLAGILKTLSEKN